MSVTLPPDLWAALDGHDADYRARYMACLVGYLSVAATSAQWEAALERSDPA